MSRPAKHFLLLLLGGLCIADTGCEPISGPEPIGRQAPVLTSFSFSPDTVGFEQLPPEQIIGGNTARIPLTMTVHARDPDGCIDRVAYVVAPALDGNGLLAEGALHRISDDSSGCRSGRYRGTVTLQLPKGAVGPYTVRVYAVDDDSLLGDQMQGLFHFILTDGEPPVIESVVAPDSVRRPDSVNVTLVPIVAVVSDPDGLSNIKTVEMLTEEGDSFSPPILLCDEGRGVPCGPFPGSGDEHASDGRFTITVRVDSDNQLGDNTFKFQATDKNGLKSELVETTITIVE